MATKKKDLDFAKEFIDFCRYKTFATVMDDFLTIVLCCYARGTQEELFEKTLARYAPEDKETFTKLLGLLHMEYIKNVTTGGGWCDPLGKMWMLYASASGKKMAGEFYTPEAVCSMMAQMTITDTEPTDTINVLDPAAGSGRTLLAAGRVSPAVNRWMKATAVDINRTTCKMCAINLFYHGISGRVICGDTLRLQAWAGYDVRPLLGIIEFVGAERATSWLVPVKRAIAPTTPPESIKPSTAQPTGSQLHLF